MVYEWAHGARVEGDAQVIGERVDQIRVINGGTVTPELLVDDAVAPESPLHPCFEWNDAVAAEKFRLDQARLVLRSLTVSITDDRRVPVRAFVAVERDDESGKTYTAVRDAMADEAMRQQIIGSALREVQSWRQRYSRLKELADLFTAVDQFKIPEE